ncbi:FHA domain-containing protein [Sphingomonas sp. PAMC 26605]|uniref:FHA domain-containing protein n=1 Tax=Sphingomonas sp. PAMC 26605 TaxID=1112214 RepID=UPI00026CA741|nr:FHA domain-containing protein [Sphingomonas sp. PAMC 26605]
MGTTLIGEPGKPARSGTTLAGPVGGSGTRLAAPLIAEQDADAASVGARGPVTGWLVVTEGPGLGRSIELGYGMNIVGRGASNRVVLDFGDEQISQDDHFRIAYDGTHRRFHLVPGRGTNLVYVAGAPLLSPLDLADRAELAVGATKLRFVALCGSDWAWPTTPTA